MIVAEDSDNIARLLKTDSKGRPIKGYNTSVHKDVRSSTIDTDETLWDPTTGTKFVITDIVASVDTAMTVTLTDQTDIIYLWYFAANGGVVMNLQTPFKSTAVNNLLRYTKNVTGFLSLSVDGYEE